MKILRIFLLLSFFIISCDKEDKENKDIPKIPTPAFNPDKTYGTVIDVEGNIYKTVTIGKQVWMAENLYTTKYRDGEEIPNVTNDSIWEHVSTAAYRWYNNDKAVYKNYGALYNFYTIVTGKLCPTGWHVPTIEEWTELETYVGGWAQAGGSLKETGFSHWDQPNKGATNKSGFTGLPGGYCTTNGIFGYSGNLGSWWSSSELESNYISNRSLIYGEAYLNAAGLGDMRIGQSVRCIEDKP